MAHPVLDSCLALHRDGRLTEAEAGYRQCLREGLDEASFPLSVLLLQQRRYAEAVDVLAPLAEAGPDDVFVYVADLLPIFAAVRERLASGGGFAFSVECSSTERTELLPETGRYRHSPRHVADAFIAAGFEGIRREAVVLRMESGNPVSGELLLARRT